MTKTGQRTAAAVLFTILLLICAALVFQGCGRKRREEPSGAETSAAETTAEAGAADATPGNATPGDAESGKAAALETSAEESLAAGTEADGSAELSGPEFPNGAALPRRGEPFPHRKGRRKPACGPGIPKQEEPVLRPVDPDLVWFATDTHYYSPSLTDYGEAFRARLDKDDGKFVQKSGELLDRFIDQAIETRPATVILSGDLCLDGETANHQELAEKLRRLTAEGISL